MRQFKSKQGSGQHRTASWWVPCGQVCISALQFRAVVEQNKKPRQEEDARAQNTNNFNDNLNNKTIFSLNVTNWSIFLVHRFSPERFSLFCVQSQKMKNVVKNIWLLWHAMLLVLARDTERRKNLSKRETRDRRFFAFPWIDFIFWKILLKSKSHFLPPFASLFFARRNVWFPKPSSHTPTMVINAQKTFFDVFRMNFAFSFFGSFLPSDSISFSISI